MSRASCESEDGGCSEGLMDRFCNLPDPIAHQILSLLTITDLTRVGCLSKRCREFHLSTPSLNFDEFSNSITSSCYKRLNLMKSLDRFLTRRGDNKIKRFRIHWDHHKLFSHKRACICDYNEKSRITAWIHIALRCNVEELELKTTLFEETPVSFPPCIFACGSLRYLSVEMNCTIQTPALESPSNLKHLDLEDVKLVDDEGFFKWLSCCCKCIEYLRLSDVHGTQNVTIESSSVESFCFEVLNQTDISNLSISCENLETLFIDWKSDFPSNISINIVAPNLKKLYWIGKLANHSNFGDFLCLEGIRFYLQPEQEEEGDKFVELCHTSRSFLVMKEKGIKALFRKGSMPALFEKLCYVHMHVGSFSDDLVPAIVFFLRGMPNLSTLYIESVGPPYCNYPKANTSGFEMRYWKLQNLAITHQLKEVTIELPNGSNGIEFARYLLEHAQNLEKMVVICLPRHSNAKAELKECNVISNATIVFEENNKIEPKMLF